MLLCFFSLSCFSFSFLPGNDSLEAAVIWIFDHENDPDIDQMPLVSSDIGQTPLVSSDIGQMPSVWFSLSLDSGLIYDK